MFEFIKEINLSGYRELAHQNNRMFTIKANHVKLYDLPNFELLIETEIQGNSLSNYINQNLLVSITHSNEICIYDNKSIKLIHVIPSASVVMKNLTEANDLLIFDRNTKETKRIKADNLDILWTSEIRKYGKYQLFAENKFFMTHFLNDHELSCLDWNTGKIIWSINLFNLLDSNFYITKLIRLKNNKLLLSVRDKVGNGKIIEINANSGEFVRIVHDRYGKLYDQDSDILFSIYDNTYWEFDLSSELPREIDLSIKYAENRKFSSNLTSFNQDYLFAYNEFEITEDQVERRYSVIDRSTFNMLWEHKCPPILEDKRRNSLPAIFIDGTLYIFFREHLWVYKQIKH